MVSLRETTESLKGKGWRPRFGIASLFILTALVAMMCYLPRLRFDLERRYEDSFNAAVKELIGVEGAQVATRVELNSFFNSSNFRVSISIPQSHVTKLWEARRSDGDVLSNSDIERVAADEISRIESSVVAVMPLDNWWADDYPPVMVKVFDEAKEQ